MLDIYSFCNTSRCDKNLLGNIFFNHATTNFSYMELLFYYIM